MDKLALRKVMAEKRDSLTEASRQAKADAVWLRLVDLEAFQKAEQALFYVSHRSEVDTTMMRHLSRELGMTVAVPRADPGSRGMHFHVLEDDGALISGPFGILQAPADAPLADLKRSSVVLIPSLAFDGRGGRLGFGTGYYDRWLAGQGQGLLKVGLAFQEQWVESIPTEAHDVPLDWVVTDQALFDCAQARASLG